MKPETAVSLALMTLFKQRGELVGFREDVARKLLVLREAGLPTLGLRLRWTPEGIESDEVARFIGRLTMGGYAVQESPIRLNLHGLQLLREEIKENTADPAVAKAMDLLGLTEGDIVPSSQAASG